MSGKEVTPKARLASSDKNDVINGNELCWIDASQSEPFPILFVAIHYCPKPHFHPIKSRVYLFTIFSFPFARYSFLATFSFFYHFSLFSIFLSISFIHIHLLFIFDHQWIRAFMEYSKFFFFTFSVLCLINGILLFEMRIVTFLYSYHVPYFFFT